MEDVVIALLAGLAGGALSVRARTTPLLGWVALAPLGVALRDCGAAAGITAALTLAAAVVAPCWTQTMRRLAPRALAPTVLSAAVGGVVAGWLLQDRAGAWLYVALPCVALLATQPLRWLGAPRWIANPLACTQEPWRAVVHVARAGDDRAVTALLAVAGASIALALPIPVVEPIAAASGALFVVVALGLGFLAMRHAERRVDRAPRVRVAAVVSDVPPPSGAPMNAYWPIQSPQYRDVALARSRYAPLIRDAASRGVELVVLPEVAVTLDTPRREEWIEVARDWAREHAITIVAPFFELRPSGAASVNTLRVLDPDGAESTYDKQHVEPGVEPPASRDRARRAHPSAHRAWPLHTVICVDLDYPDLVRPVRDGGGLLAAPANDWLDGFEEVHHRTAIWAAVCSGVSVVRATGHGISSVIDAAGRTLARACSRGEPVVLVVDAPLVEGSARRGGAVN
ncbi:MAG: nitrilase-related carbon-nitrogen hydrolase [Sandaracinaceae bacterium]